MNTLPNGLEERKPDGLRRDLHKTKGRWDKLSMNTLPNGLWERKPDGLRRDLPRRLPEGLVRKWKFLYTNPKWPGNCLVVVLE